MKLGPVTKLEKKKIMMTSCQQIVISLSFFQFLANLEQSGSQILDTYFVKSTFSLLATSYLTKTENRTKKPSTQFPHYCFEYRYYF